jgi:hypothetical protein
MSDEGGAAPGVLAHSRTAFYTPAVGITPSRIHHEVRQLGRRLDYAIDEHLHPTRELFRNPPQRSYVELLIIDEADRVKTTALEALRDFFDRRPIGLILIGMPGLEKRLARYPQLYSRIGFAHQYRSLGADELRFVLTHHWRTLGLELADKDFTDTEAIATVAGSPTATSCSSTASSPRSSASLRSINSRRSRARSSKPRAKASSSANPDPRQIALPEHRQMVLNFTIQWGLSMRRMSGKWAFSDVSTPAQARASPAWACSVGNAAPTPVPGRCP